MYLFVTYISLTVCANYPVQSMNLV